MVLCFCSVIHGSCIFSRWIVRVANPKKRGSITYCWRLAFVALWLSRYVKLPGAVKNDWLWGHIISLKRKAMLSFALIQSVSTASHFHNKFGSISRYKSMPKNKIIVWVFVLAVSVLLNSIPFDAWLICLNILNQAYSLTHCHHLGGPLQFFNT